MRSALLYFREGPNTAKYDIKGAWDQPICLHHEISSCEPSFSWNILHSHQLGDRYRFLEGMYSIILGAMSQQTYIGCEHRGGMSGSIVSAPLGICAIRLSVIDDQVRLGELHLMRLVPVAWLSEKSQTVFEDIPTEYGPVTLRFRLADDGKRLDISFEPRFRHQPNSILLHVPPLERLREVTVNGQAFAAKPGDTLAIE